MKRSGNFTKVLLAVLGLTLALGATVPMPATAQESLLERLQHKVAALSTEQQAALLLLLKSLSGDDGQEEAAADQKAIAAMTEASLEAMTSEDVDAMLSLCSEDFDSATIGDKSDLALFLEKLADIGVFFDPEIDMSTSKTAVDGETAKVGPVEISTFGYTVTVGFMLSKANGEWLLTDVAIDPENLVELVMNF